MVQNPKSNTVKATIDSKKGTLRLEGPQEFVEKYLDSIIQNCKPFSTSSPHEEESESSNKERDYRYFTAESHGSLSLSLIIVALLNRSLAVSTWYVPAILGVIILLIGLYLILPSHMIQKWLLRKVFNKYELKTVKWAGWAIVLALFGYGLTQTGIPWLTIFGALTAVSSYAVLTIGFLQIAKRLIKGNSKQIY